MLMHPSLLPCDRLGTTFSLYVVADPALLPIALISARLNSGLSTSNSCNSSFSIMSPATFASSSNTTALGATKQSSWTSHARRTTPIHIRSSFSLATCARRLPRQVLMKYVNFEIAWSLKLVRSYLSAVIAMLRASFTGILSSVLYSGSSTE